MLNLLGASATSSSGSIQLPVFWSSPPISLKYLLILQHDLEYFETRNSREKSVTKSSRHNLFLGHNVGPRILQLNPRLDLHHDAATM
jgi:hypothetical protein